MELVGIEQLKPGEVVAKAVENASGAVLCPEGYVLTEQAIGRLKNAGVDSVLVQKSLDNSVEIDARLTALEARFAGIDHPIMKQIQTCLRKQLEALRV